MGKSKGTKVGAARRNSAGKGQVLAPRRPIDELASDLLVDPAAWFRSPNLQLGGRCPGDLLGTDEEDKVYSLLNAVDLGLF